MFYSTLLLLIPPLILAIWAQSRVSSTFNKYSRVKSSVGEPGYMFARRLLDSVGLYDVNIERVRGNLTDHYDPTKKVLRLSDATYNSSSIAALGVVAHEAGHAIQHAKGYKPLVLRNLSVPLAGFGSNMAWIIFFVGLIFSTPFLLNAGIFLFLFVVLFSVITLPVEFNASKRALKLLPVMGMSKDEVVGARKVLSAAALTYVAAALMSIAQLLRMLLLARSRN